MFRLVLGRLEESPEVGPVQRINEIRDVEQQLTSSSPHREWAEAYLLYSTFTGDMVLMKDSGEAGWALAAEQRMCPLAPSFSNFVEPCAIWYQDRGVLDYYNWVERFSQE